jgi:hypothetical protein
MIVVYAGKQKAYNYHNHRFDNGMPSFCPQNIAREISRLDNFELYDESKKYNSCNILCKIDDNLQFFLPSICVIDRVRQCFPTANIYVNCHKDYEYLLPGYCNLYINKLELYRTFDLTIWNHNVKYYFQDINRLLYPPQDALVRGIKLWEPGVSISNNYFKKYYKSEKKESIIFFTNSLFPTKIDSIIDELPYKIIKIYRNDRSELSKNIELLKSALFFIDTDNNELVHLCLYFGIKGIKFIDREFDSTDCYYDRFNKEKTMIHISPKSGWFNSENEKIKIGLEKILNEYTTES